MLTNPFSGERMCMPAWFVLRQGEIQLSTSEDGRPRGSKMISLKSRRKDFPDSRTTNRPTQSQELPYLVFRGKSKHPSVYLRRRSIRISGIRFCHKGYFKITNVSRGEGRGKIWNAAIRGSILEGAGNSVIAWSFQKIF